MWPFKRANKINSAVPSIPPEVKEYYQAEHRERLGVAWLIAFITLILTIAVVMGLFFGGRWTYRKISHKSNPPSQLVVTEKPKVSTNSSNGSKATTNPTPPAVSPTSSGGSVTPANTGVSSNSKLTNTGPGNTLAVFIIVSTVAGLTHYQLVRRKYLSNFNG